jgi:hypothetical protein
MRERKRRTPKRRGGKVVYFNAEDRAILEEAKRLDGLTGNDVIRRALRAYHRKLLRAEKLAS